jgi:rhodanese-related sulfurtransferase
MLAPDAAEDVGMKKGFRQMLAEAEAEIETLPPADAMALRDDPSVLFIDLRDPRELEREGRIPGSFHCTRGMLEFWIDPDSPYHKPVFAEDKRFVFYCSAGWRSALAAKTAQDMGLEKVAHVGGGFGAWREAGGAVETVEKRK